MVVAWTFYPFILTLWHIIFLEHAENTEVGMVYIIRQSYTISSFHNSTEVRRAQTGA